jgi:hypothetical protein
MRYKEHTVNKLDAQAMKIESLKRAIESGTMSVHDVLNFLEGVRKELKLVVERLELEPNE